MSQTETAPTMPFRIAIDGLSPLDPTRPIGEIQSFIAANVERDYARYHSPRFAHLLHHLAPHVTSMDQTILDMGASELTDLLRHAFKRKVDVLDYHPDVQSESGDLFFIDLNTVDRPDEWRKDLKPYDIVVMAEVFEHLYASPESIFRFLKTFVKPNGILVIQTPNGLALRRRLMMLLGRHPFNPIRDGDKFGSHVREYTLKELRHYGETGGFSMLSASLGSYFDVRYGDDKSPARILLKRILYAITLPSQRPGITMIFRKNG